MHLGSLLKSVRKDYQRIPVKGVCFDSRKIKKKDIFFAIQGEKTSGTKFVKDAISKGASAIVSNRKLPLNERFAAQLKLSKLPKNSAKTRIRNRCEITGRPHGVYRKLKISRIALRQMASAGKIPGMTKSSW